tara:strand:- start:1377 stop:2375 length:999 start_codon:yes stop_codon:yes gene_type:complete
MNRKPQILIIADFPNWAYYFIQQFIVKNLSEEFDIYSDFLGFNTSRKSKRPWVRFKNLLDRRKYQNIRKDREYDLVVSLAHYIPDLVDVKWTSKKSIIGIYTDGFPPRNANFDGSIDDFYNQKLKKYDAIVVGANSIKSIYESVSKNVYFANMAYDQDFFNRLSPKVENNTKDFIIGWTGQATRDFKGYYTHVVPAIEIVQKIYPQITLKSRFSGPIETLPRFYDDVDLVVIASDADAGPFLFCEASLMSIPCISTRIGMVQDVIVDNVNGIFIDKRIDIIVENIIHLYENRDILHSMSRRIRSDFICKLGATVMTTKWIELFNNVLASDEQ